LVVLNDGYNREVVSYFMAIGSALAPMQKGHPELQIIGKK